VTIAFEQTLTLEGDAYDVDSGTLPDERLQWSSSRDGGLGSGPSLDVASLSVGQHTITFRADDGEGGVTTDSVEVTVVADISELPPVPDALVVGPSLLTLDEANGAALSIENENTLAMLTWEANVSDAWIRLSAASGVTPSDVAVTLDPTGLAPGHYTGSITVNSGADSQRITVEATVASSCVGDCDGDGSVTVNELIRGVNIALGNATIDDCPSFDATADGSVSISELVQGVNAALNGCA
jgi:hypothetical protein